MATIKLRARPRTEVGSRAMKSLREAGKLPGVIYGHKKANRLVTFEAKEMIQFIRAGHRLVSVEVDDVEENGVLKEVQYSSHGTEVIHVDIARVDIHEKISMPVRIETIGVAKGLSAGGSLNVNKRDVMVEGPASAIPEKIEVNIENLELGQSIRVRDLKPLPECRFLDDSEQVVVAVLLKKIEEEVPAAAAAAAPEMPEVIGKKPSEEEAEEPEAKGKEPESKKKESKEKE